MDDDDEVFGELNKVQSDLVQSEKKLKQQLKALDQHRARAAQVLGDLK